MTRTAAAAPAESAPAPSRRRPDAKGLRTSRYERVSSLLAALLWLIGAIVAFLFLVWLTTRFTFTNRTVPVTPIEIAGSGQFAEGVARELEEPGVEELAEVEQPQLAETLQALTDVVSTQQGSWESITGTAEQLGRGTGEGDSRMSGPGGGGVEAIPPWKRWEVRFSATNLREYARQLDHFKIELGAIGGSALVDYAAGFSGGAPTRRSGSPAGDQRLYFSFVGEGQVAQWQTALLDQAGVPTAGRQTLQFYPADLEGRLATLEREAARGRSVQDVAKTIFAVTPLGDGYDVQVAEIRFKGG